MKTATISLICLLICGCASSGSDCTSDAYALGQRDGRLGASLEQQANIYGARCGAQVDGARYAEGWREANGSRPIPLW
jgi:hypothetical protein